MSSSKRPLPSRPNLESDKKAAKVLKKAVSAGDRAAALRVRESHPAFQSASPEAILASRFSLRDAQLVIAREYGFDDWSQWKVYAESSSGDIDTLFKQACRAINYKQRDTLETLIRDYPQLLVATDSDGYSLLSHTTSYANNPGDDLSLWTSLDCAQLLVDQGARVEKDVINRALDTADTRMVRMFVDKKAVSPDLVVAAAIGDREMLRSALKKAESDRKEGLGYLAEAFKYAVRHNQPETARLVLEALRRRGADGFDRLGSLGKNDNEILGYLLENRGAIEPGPRQTAWEMAQRVRLSRALSDGDLDTFGRVIEETPEFLSSEYEEFQTHCLEVCAYSNKPQFARALLDAGASVAKTKPATQALVYAIDYGATEMISILSEIWQPKTDLPTAAGLGDLASVKSFFDENGRLKSTAATVYPRNVLSENPDEILLHALGLALMNENIDVAEYLVEHGADINGRWGLHEPAGLLHECVSNGRKRSVQFLLEKGVDVAMRDDRFGGLAIGWAEYGGMQDMVELLRPYTVSAEFIASVEYGDIADVQAHLDAGADANEKKDFVLGQDMVPLFFAVGRGSLPIVRLLLDRGADPLHLDSNRRGAMHRFYSDETEVLQIAELLLEQGCDINHRDNKGLTPLAQAKRDGLPKLTRFLERMGARL